MIAKPDYSFFLFPPAASLKHNRVFEKPKWFYWFWNGFTGFGMNLGIRFQSPRRDDSAWHHPSRFPEFERKKPTWLAHFPFQHDFSGRP